MFHIKELLLNFVKHLYKQYDLLRAFESYRLNKLSFFIYYAGHEHNITFDKKKLIEVARHKKIRR